MITDEFETFSSYLNKSIKLLENFLIGLENDEVALNSNLLTSKFLSHKNVVLKERPDLLNELNSFQEFLIKQSVFLNETEKNNFIKLLESIKDKLENYGQEYSYANFKNFLKRDLSGLQSSLNRIKPKKAKENSTETNKNIQRQKLAKFFKLLNIAHNDLCRFIAEGSENLNMNEVKLHLIHLEKQAGTFLSDSSLNFKLKDMQLLTNFIRIVQNSQFSIQEFLNYKNKKELSKCVNNFNSFIQCAANFNFCLN
jgi:hypothetical protein